MNTLKYKDFIGSVAFSEPDGVFFGKIEGIDGLVNFEGESVAELTNAFHEAVDHYLAYCAEEDIQPHKSYSGSLNVRLTPDILAASSLSRYIPHEYDQIKKTKYLNRTVIIF